MIRRISGTKLHGDPWMRSPDSGCHKTTDSWEGTPANALLCNMPGRAGFAGHYWKQDFGKWSEPVQESLSTQGGGQPYLAEFHWNTNVLKNIVFGFYLLFSLFLPLISCRLELRILFSLPFFLPENVRQGSKKINNDTSCTVTCFWQIKP